MLGMTPFFAPKLGAILLFCALLHWIHGDNVKGNYNAMFLETIDFAFKKCHFTFVPKAEQLQAIHVVVTGNDGFVKGPLTTSVLCAPLLLLLSGQSNRPVRFRNIPELLRIRCSICFFNPNAFLLSFHNLKVEVVSQITWRFSFLGGRPFFTVFISLLTRTQHPNNAKNTIFKH